MTHRKFSKLLTGFVVLPLLDQQAALAGMPSISLSDLARFRLSTISFFLFLVVLTAIGIRFLWNSLRRDFPALPALTFRGALTGVVLWGLVFVVVLTMISGARELMSPGVWVKNGLTYKPADQPPQTDSERIAIEVARQLKEQTGRIMQLQLLGTALTDFAARHNGVWPTAEQFLQLPSELRTLPGDMPADYVYRPEASGESQSETSSADLPVVVEPAVFGDGQQLALYRSGLVGPFRRTP